MQMQWEMGAEVEGEARGRQGGRAAPLDAPSSQTLR
jgi:hypothetical protein